MHIPGNNHAAASASSADSPLVKTAAPLDCQAPAVSTGVAAAETPAQAAVATAAPAKKPAAFMNMAQAEAAYDAGRISEDRYDRIIDQLEAEMDAQIDWAELD